MRRALERSASPNVEFLGRVDEPTLAGLYRRTRALIYPQLEDFGLIAVEAQGAGRPVIAFGAGGALDTVRPLPRSEADCALEDSDATGVFFDRHEPDALAEAIERFEKAESIFEPTRLRRWANRFSPQRFDVAFDRELAATLDTTVS